MKYKSKFKRVRAQAGIGDMLTGNQPQLFNPTNADPNANWNWYNPTSPSPVNPNGVTPGPEVSAEGTPNNMGKIVPLDGTTKVTRHTGVFKENPYVEAFNYAASGVTSIANIIQNNKLKDKEYGTLLHSLEPAYMENMEGDGLNNLPMYTQYGGGPAGFGANTEDPGIAHHAFYGDQSIYQYGGRRKYAAGGGLTPQKAAEILHDGTIHGKPISEAQRKYFGWIANGGKKQGGGNGQDQIAQIIQLFAQLQGQDPREIMAQLQQMPQDQQQQAIQKMAEVIQAEQQGQQQGQPQGQTMQAGGQWIQKAIKHPGRCANPGDEDCPEGSPQYNLAMRFKHGDLHKTQAGGSGVPNVYGLPDEFDQFADVEAEAGEIIQKQGGGYVKVADNAKTHEQGGEMIPGVKRVLEDTSDKRKDKASKILKVTPDMMQEAFGVKIKSPVTHSKAFEIANKELDKTNNQYQGAKKDANLRTNLDKTNMNTIRLNKQFQEELPSPDDIFELLYLHQEGVKHEAGINDDGSMAQYGGRKKAGKYQAGGGLKGKQNIQKDLKTPKGNVNQVNFPGGLPALVEKWKGIIPGIENVTDPAQFQKMTYDYLAKNQPDLIDQTIWGEGLNRQGINMFKSGKDKAFNEAVSRAFDPKTFAPKKGYAFTQQDREALASAYPDSYLMNRLVVPEQFSSTTDVPEPQPGQPGVTFNPGVNVNPRIIKQPNNGFYEPTYWSDVAAPMAGLVDSFRRWPELYNPTEYHQLRYKLLDPTAALTANQADFNAAVDETGNMGTGVGNASRATMLGQKYRANNQVMSQYDNQNAGIKNNEITYNTQVRDKQSVADAQARGDFYQKVLLGREAQRQQSLTSISQLARVDQLKRRQNTSGNLMMKLSPAFDQFGEYNGYQYSPYVDPSMLMYTDTPKSTGKYKTTKSTSWKDASGKTRKVTTSE